MIDHSSIRILAKDMPDGVQERFNHDNCPAGADFKRRLYIRNRGGVFLAYCHNCGESGIWSQSRIKTLMELNKLEQGTGPKLTTALPEDYTTDTSEWPLSARDWVFKYGITEQRDIFKIGYSDSFGRVVLPVFRDANLLFWQGRLVGVPKSKYVPKYLNSQSVEKPHAIFSARGGTSLTSPLVIVEDYLSGIRASRYADTVVLFGTHLDLGSLRNCLSGKSFTNAFVCLDNDAAGRKASEEACRKLRLAYCFHVHNIAMPAEFKHMDDRTVRELVSRGFGTP
jgi:hypothetical protein